ncbi:MAG: sulfotransferase family protein [Alphaproteobacteria bacterium]|nr:MAG: sulfotransferase family protein [Alphaproteobacteria bacterium]
MNSAAGSGASKTSSGRAEIQRAAALLADGKVGDAEAACRDLLKRDPLDVSAMCLLADIGLRLGALSDVENLLHRCLELAPDYHLARGHLAHFLFKRHRFDDALVELDRIDAAKAGNRALLLLRAQIYVRVGRTEEALEIYEQAEKDGLLSASLQMSLGHTYKTLGRQVEAIEAYRQAVRLNPAAGEAFWSLANLKTYRFSPEEISAMREVASDENVGREEFLHTCFSLGKALEDAGEYDEAFLHYQRGNAVRRRTVRYDAEVHRREMEALKEFFSPEQVKKLEGAGNPACDPIFIVGLPRAGSTLIEQILASHSQVEGTQELPDLISIGRRLAAKDSPDNPSQYPQVLAQMSPSRLTALGAEYLERTRIHRTGAPYFIDKMPNNFAHIGLLHAILPNATVIDARRNPMDCCFSGYKQLFAKGQNFTYSLRDIGRYYRDYVELMRHWDSVLPSKVVRVFNEDMIADPEGQIRRLLDAMGLPFEQACLEFHKNDRAVRTASSEQVRQPINAKGVDRWRNFEPHLDMLKEALGPALTNYRD